MNKNIIPDWKIERYLLGELPKREIEMIRALEESNDGLRERVNALRANNAELIKMYPPENMIRRVEANFRAETFKPASHWRRAIPYRAVPVFACAAALLIVPIWLFQSGIITNTAADNTRIKGMESRLEVWRKDGNHVERLISGAEAEEGDLVQLRYVVPEVCYGAIMSVDGRGHLTVHLSGDAGKAVKLTPGRPVALDHAYELDDAKRFEIFYLITAPQNFSLDAAAQLVKKTDGLNGVGVDVGAGVGVAMPALSRNQQVVAFVLKKN